MVMNQLCVLTVIVANRPTHLIKFHKIKYTHTHMYTKTSTNEYNLNWGYLNKIGELYKCQYSVYNVILYFYKIYGRKRNKKYTRSLCIISYNCM